MLFLGRPGVCVLLTGRIPGARVYIIWEAGKLSEAVGCSAWNPCFHMDPTLTCSTNLSIVADHVHSYKVSPDGCDFFQQNNALWHKAKIGQE